MTDRDYLVVAAFDIGTTYSGYALSFRDDPSAIRMNHKWVAGNQQHLSLKTPTCLLLDKNEKFHSFGYEAEDEYASLCADNKHAGWRLFRHFKMTLHKDKVRNRYENK